jgi:hypothetical protein
MSYKTPGQLLFDSYDTGNVIYREWRKGGRKKAIAISQFYPRKDWGQLTTGERNNWEQIATTNSNRWSTNT